MFSINKILCDNCQKQFKKIDKIELINDIEEVISSFEDFVGIHDLIVHNYGVGKTIISLHCEVDYKGDINRLHDMIDAIEVGLNQNFNCMATIHMDPIVTDDEKVTSLRKSVAEAVKEIDERLTIHDFRYVEGITHSNLIFDVTVPFEIKENNERIKELVSNKIAEMSPNYFAVITIDRE